MSFNNLKYEICATGQQGPKGDIGPEGKEGPRGPYGLTGDVGPVGPQGPIGPIGPIGPVGPQGPQGVQGEVGPEGPEFNMGAKVSDRIKTINSVAEFVSVPGYTDNFLIEGNTDINVLKITSKKYFSDDGGVFRTRFEGGDVFNPCISNGWFTVINHNDKKIHVVGLNNNGTWYDETLEPYEEKLLILPDSLSLCGVDYYIKDGWVNDLTLYHLNDCSVFIGDVRGKNKSYIEGVKSVGEGSRIDLLNFNYKEKLDLGVNTYIEGYYIENGEYQGGDHLCVEQFIEVEEGVNYILENVAYATLYYDENKNVRGYNLDNKICNYLYPYHNSIHHAFYTEITIPKGIKYIRISITEGSQGKFNIYKGCQYNYNKINETLRTLKNSYGDVVAQDIIEPTLNGYIVRKNCYQVQLGKEKYFILGDATPQHGFYRCHVHVYGVPLPDTGICVSDKFSSEVFNFETPYRECFYSEVKNGVCCFTFAIKESIVPSGKNILEFMQTYLEELKPDIVYSLKDRYIYEINNFNVRSFEGKNKLFINSKDVLCETSFVYSETLRSEIDILEEKMLSIERHEHSYQKHKLTQDNGISFTYSYDANKLVDVGNHLLDVLGTNKPDDGYFHLEVIRSYNNILQRATNILPPNKTYCRSTNDGGITWSPWVSL